MNFKLEQHCRAVVRLASIVALLSCALGLLCASAFAAEEPHAGWELTAESFPTYLSPGGRAGILIRPVNVGAAFSQGAVTVTDTLPPGVVATQAGADAGMQNVGPNEIEPEFEAGRWDCSGNGPGGSVDGATIVRCANDPNGLPSLAGGGGIPTGPTDGGFDSEVPVPELAIAVTAPTSEGVITMPNRVTIAGGGALNVASTSEPVTVSSKPVPFGLADVDGWFSNADGTLDTQAGSHPYEATFLFDMNNALVQGDFPPEVPAGGEERNLTFSLPPGFIGDPYVVPMCTRQQFNSEKCPPASQVGVIAVEALGQQFFQTFVVHDGAPVYNIVPPEGEPSELGFQLEGVNTQLGIDVRSGSDYGLTTHINNIVTAQVMGSVLTLWGEPGDPSHSLWHAGGAAYAGGHTGGVANVGQPPYLTLPTSCEGPQTFSLSANAWENPSLESHLSVLTHNSNGEPVGFTGCGSLGFGTSITTAPDTSDADTPAGLTVEVKPELGGLFSAEGLGTSDIKETTVTLPPGVVINPGQAAGLAACQESESGLGTENAPSCPLASRVGTDEITLPILKDNLVGNVYVLQSEPPNIRLLIAASGEGVNVKLVGHVHLNEQTGQLTTTVSSGISLYPNIPQAPVSNFKLSFSGGAQAALDTPTACGTYTTESRFASWASPLVAEVSPTSSFAVTKGTDGAPCPGPVLPFSPSLIAGSTTDQAGGFTSFSLLLQTPDDQQRISGLQFKVPKGLLGMISKVPLCPEPQASAGTCSSTSQIGHTTVASGPGPYPLVVPQPGQPPAAIYLTGPYKGAPYGLSIVVPVVVGPFTLETQIVRAKIEVDPLTAQITVSTDPLPQVIDGVPTDLRTVNAVIDRPGFMFNPTNCSLMSFSGTAYSAQGGNAAISTPFQMGSCRSLLFKPNFKVSTSGKTSRKDGASLDAKIVYPMGALGANQASSQSNLKSVKVDLPKQLPSRLTTLQKACLAATFEANPASCPTDSRVGTVTAVTPVLPVTLTGPAYFVSYGGAKFPELVIALQGYGVTIYVHGETFINKAGITSSTFHQVPDVPIYSFELKLPEGPYSALAANGNLCASTLKMPTSFTAQDGAVIHQTTPITATGCPKHKNTKTKKKTKAKKQKQHKDGTHKK